MPRDTDAHGRGDDEPEDETIPVQVWDVPTRLFHWSLVTLVGLSWWAGATGTMQVHMISGLTILAVVLFRLVWGVIGSTTARFTDFVRGPGEALAYVEELTGRRPPRRWVGHNPVGGLMVVAILAVLLVQTATGLFANDDIVTEGPLGHLVSKATSDTLTIIHKSSFKLLLGMVSLHIAAALFYLLAKRENLIGAMITGRKHWPATDPRPVVKITNPFWALVTLAAVSIAVWQMVTRL